MSYDWRENRKNHIEDHRRHNNDYRRRHPERVKAQQRTYWAENVEEMSIRRKKRQPYLSRQIKLDVFSHYSNGAPKCAQCGEDDLRVLCIDHINDNGAEERKKINKFGGTSFYYWLKNNDYPEGYQVLCANCNVRKEFKRRQGGLHNV